MISQDSKNGLRNPWFLGMLGLIVVVLGVNAVFIWLAMQNRPSLVDRDYSTRDRKSDTAALNDLKARKALGWQVTVKRPDAIAVNSQVAFEIGVTDRAGAPVSGQMEVGAYRASDASRDFVTVFREVAPGSYRGQIGFTVKGSWELRIRIERGEDVFEVDTGKFRVAG